MENVIQWYRSGFSRWCDFGGRSRRAEYWTFTLINSIIIAGGQVFAATLASPGESNTVAVILSIVLIIFTLATIIPTLSLQIRRMHDIGKSGWWLLINFVPLVGPLIFLVFSITDSQPGANQYGTNPKGM